MWFYSRGAAAYSALVNLRNYLPAEPDNEGKEWGTVIYRVPFSDGSWGYCYQPPYRSNTSRRWSPAGDHMYREYGSVPAGYCHTHPTREGLSTSDTEFVDVNPSPYKEGSVAYMVNLDGAYWYDGRSQAGPKTSRMGLIWGKWWT